MDRLFVNAKQGLVSLAPEELRLWIGAAISAASIIAVYAGLFALTTILERKGLGRIQNRYGPNRVGPFGLLQPLADGLKALVKEDVRPATADKVLHSLAPLLLVLPAFLALAVVPMGRDMVALDVDVGLLFFFAVGAATEVAVFMAGWSSRNKYSILGAMRAVAQMISYEMPLILSSMSVVLAAGTLSMTGIVAAQEGYYGIVPNWHVFTPWGAGAFLLFLISGLAESNRSPFDLPEGESEIVAGYYIEYSGFKFALFFLGEYIGLFAMSGVAITLFLGGWHAPLPFLGGVPGWLWFFAKLLILICVFIWIRGTLPRLRMDQLMKFGWKFLLPMAVVTLVAAAIWVRMPSGIGRWLLSSVLVLGVYALLGRALFESAGFAKRVYRYAQG